MPAISKADVSLPSMEHSQTTALGMTAPATISDLSVKDEPSKAVKPGDFEKLGERVRATLRARLGEDIFSSWFKALEIENFDGKTVRVSVPVKFLRNWIQSHYLEDLLACCQVEFKGAENVDVTLRQPGGGNARPAQPQNDAKAGIDQHGAGAGARAAGGHDPIRLASVRPAYRPNQGALPAGTVATAGTASFEGSPLDPQHTFQSFVVGAPNRMAHAGAVQVAETLLTGNAAFNPLFLYSSVGMGKTHLLHAIAWEVRRRASNANVLYLTAERYRYQFVEALRNQNAQAFKEKFRSVDLLLIDDLEFLQGEKTEQEFEHTINAFLDGGRQVVVASSRHPAQIERLNERMRSRLQRGLVAEIGGFDHELRMRVLEQRLAERKSVDPEFDLSYEVLNVLATRLTENGRELEGAINRLFLTWQHMRAPITLDIVETIVRDLFQGVEPRRIKIEDIQRVISRHFGVSKGDLLSQRRHRSVVWPRQIGMYLAKQLTQRSLPEIGRRFGNRDHTTVLHAIRKIEGVIADDAGLREELEDIKKQLTH